VGKLHPATVWMDTAAANAPKTMMNLRYLIPLSIPSPHPRYEKSVFNIRYIELKGHSEPASLYFIAPGEEKTNLHKKEEQNPV
jgi:hypothetical protein